MSKIFRGLIFLLLIAALFAAITPAYSQTQKEYKVNGAVELGVSKEYVLRILGKPDSPQKFDFFYEKSGNELIVCFDDKTKKVESIIVRGKNPAYSVSGIKIGDLRAQVKEIYGDPEKIIKYRKSGVECWYYPSKNVSFALSGDKVASFGVSSVTFISIKK